METFINRNYRLFCSKYAEDILKFINGYNFADTSGKFYCINEYAGAKIYKENGEEVIPYWDNKNKYLMSEVWAATSDLFQIMCADRAFYDLFSMMIIILNTEEADLNATKNALTSCESIIKHLIYKYFGIKENPDKGYLSLGTCQRAFKDTSKNYFSNALMVLRHARNKCHAEKPKEIPDSNIIRLRFFQYIISVIIGIIVILNKEKSISKNTSYHPIREQVTVKILKSVGYEKIHITSVSGKQNEPDFNEIDESEGAEIREFTIPIQRYQPIEFKICYECDGESKTDSCSVSLDMLDNTDYVLDLYLSETGICPKFITPHNYDAYHEEITDNCVVMSITSDLECKMVFSGMAQTAQIRPGEYTKMLVPKGRKQTITLTSSKNPKYEITREIDVDKDPVIVDMLFVKEVRRHREWWDVKDIVVMRDSIIFNKELGWATEQFVLWDRSVDLPVYFCGNDSSLEDCKTGFVGNLFYVKKRDGYYNYYSLDDSDKHFLGKHLFTFTDGYEFTGVDGCGDALVIDEEGRTLYTIHRAYKFTEWNEKLKKQYEEFISQFKFSDNGYAAMIGPDGTSVLFVTDKWVPASDPYSYVPKEYPVFRKGYCAVKKGEEGYLFLKSTNGYIKETNERYDSLRPVEIGGNWIYIAKKDGKYGILNPAANDDVVIIPIEYDEIIQEHGICKIKKDGKWVKLYGTDICHVLAPPYEHIDISADFIGIGKLKDDGTICKYLCTKDRIIASDVLDWRFLPYGLSEVKLSNGSWSMYDIEGNCLLEDYCEAAKSIHSIVYDCRFLGIKKDEQWEVWKVDKSHLSQVIKGISASMSFLPSALGFKFVDQKKHRLEVDINGVTAIEYAGQWVWEKNKEIVLPEGPKGIVNQDVSNGFMRSLVIPFSKFKEPGKIGLMERDTFKEIVAPNYQDIFRVGNIWVAKNEGIKTIFSDTGVILAENLKFDSIKKYNTDLYYAEKEGDVCLINAKGEQKSNKFYSEIRPIAHGYAAVRGFRWGFVRITGEDVEEICGFEYHAVKDFTEEGYAMVQKDENGAWGMIASDGNLVVDCKYAYIAPFKCNFTSVRTRGNVWGIISRETGKICPLQIY